VPRLPQIHATPSRWMALARPNVKLVELGHKNWVRAVLLRKMAPWTDDYTNLLDTLGE
jgi:hypothetical protein